jgi:alpha-mannosidase
MFHDTLPGSSIHLAVEDYDRKFTQIHKEAKDLFHEAIKALRGDKTSSQEATFINTLPSLSRREIVPIGEDGWCVASVDARSMCSETQALQPDEGVNSKPFL